VWIIRACQCISPKAAVKNFKNYCISNAVDESDDVLQNSRFGLTHFPLADIFFGELS